jgi:acetyl esterase/lipase
MPTIPELRSIIANIAALVIAGLVVALEIWTIAPGPTLATLALAVIVPEAAPWGVAACLAAIAIAQILARGWARTVATVLSAFALGFAIVPFFFVHTAIANADREMRLALGPDYAVAAPDRDRARMTATPFNLATSFAGYPRDTAIRDDLGLRVQTRDGTRLRLDLYRPETSGMHATIVLIYGGAWRFGSRSDVAQRARAYASLGYTAIAVEYRHAPAFRYPTQIEDVQDALASIARHATDWDVDRTRIAIVGYSAGAELALLAAYAPEPVTVKAVIAFYAPVDLIGGYTYPPVPDPARVRAILTNYIGGAPAQEGAKYAAASPIAHIRAGLPATLLIGGARDELVRLGFQHEMRDRLRVQSDVVAAIDLPWSNHAFDELQNGLGGQISRYFTERFLAATL